ncbi:hypothetical protein O0I10_011784 [Lichtheimia ornata]|uniref:Uncharacterized protein n=1 Tax=Lichtheimia ornata TaxID=688661 RepID=A0AAD7XQ60_9FUNG|nr:uncharacterized protein O0I10_011784 [Lichtheimia ornata]KAJ8652579.1 hypothetical protein O0I10_011784 [Lichtheimia ornata]
MRQHTEQLLDCLLIQALRGHHHDVVEDTSSICHEEVIPLLMIRANSMAACAKFEQALEIANMAIDMDPSSAWGYLCKGHILAQQGYHQRAIQVYDAGLSIDLQDESNHTRLACRRSKSKKALENRMDPMTTLPIDVMLFDILPLVLGERMHDFDKLSPYMEVSRTWCVRVITASEYKMVIPSSSCINMEHKAMGEYAWLLQHLVLNDCHVDFPHLAKKWNLQSLKYLHIKGIVFKCMRRLFINLSIGSIPPLTIDLVNALRVSGFYIFDLKLDFSKASGEFVLPMYRILETCPNLKSLTCIPGVPNADEGPQQPTVYPQLRHLSVQGPRGAPTFNDMYHFLSQFPELETLEAKLPFTTSRILAMIHHLCPRLKRLLFGSRDDYHTSDYEYQGDLDVNESKGLCHLDIGMQRASTENQAYSQDDVAMICMHNHTSLQDFRYMGWLSNTCEITQKSVSMTRLPMVFEQLSYMEIRLELPADQLGGRYFTWHRRTTAPQFPPFVEWMILHAPMLHTLTIATKVPIDVDVFTAMRDLNNLVRLNLNLHEGSTMQAMTAFLDHHFHLGSSPLSFLHIRIKEQLNPTLISSLARLPCIQSLHVDYFGPLVTTVFDPLMSTLAVNHSQVKELQLSCQFQEVSLSALQSLPDLGSLTKLKIHAHKIPYNAFEPLRECTKLKVLEIRVESPSPDEDDQIVETLLISQSIHKVVYITTSIK